MNRKEINLYLKRNDLSIEGNVCTWNIATHGDIQGLYTGNFKFKCYLTPSEKLAAGRAYRELLGSNAALAFKSEDNLAFALSQLRYRIISAPPFWNSAIGVDGQGGDIPDEKVLDAILEAAMSSELKYIAQLQNKKEQIIKKTKESAEKLLAQKEGEMAEEEGSEGTP